MEQFDFFNRGKKRLESLKELISKGSQLGFDVSAYLEKINRVIGSLQDEELRIVLLGSFSDGKTSAIAGLLGHLEEDMKIDNDESSDELRIYHPLGMKGVKIIDTPGLFGTKEKDIDGKNIKFSEITERYISEAHIIVYVCAAVVPLKESHAEIIRRVLRTYHKLDNTIFVINKMDEAGYDLTDDEDYKYGKEIKKQNLINRLRSTINLTPEEEKRLNVICISADPKGKGLPYWFSKMQDYYQRSHIDELRKIIKAVSEKSDVSQLQEESVEASVRDMLEHIGDTIEQTNIPVRHALKKIERQLPDLQEDQRQLKSELALSRNNLREMIDNIRVDVINDIKGASQETIGDIIEKDLGTKDGEVTFFVFQDKINSQIEMCCETNARSVNSQVVKLQTTYSMQENMVREALGKGVLELKRLNITGEQVKMVRNVVAKGYKFKPWGAIKLGQNITKWAGWIGAGVGVAMEAYSWYKKHENEKKLQELKEQLISVVNDCVKQVSESFQDESAYYKNYAPSYIELCSHIQERNQEIEQMKQRIKLLDEYKASIDQWDASSNIEDAEYEEI